MNYKITYSIEWSDLIYTKAKWSQHYRNSQQIDFYEQHPSPPSSQWRQVGAVLQYVDLTLSTDQGHQCPCTWDYDCHSAHITINNMWGYHVGLELGKVPIHGEGVHFLGAQVVSCWHRGWSCQGRGSCKIATTKLCEKYEELFGALWIL